MEVTNLERLWTNARKNASWRFGYSVIGLMAVQTLDILQNNFEPQRRAGAKERAKKAGWKVSATLL